MTTMTNRHDIDPAIVKVVTDDPFYDTPDCDISVTGLTRPPQMAYLEQIHQHEIVEDVADTLWRLLGQGVHEVIRKGAVADADFPEERLYADIDGWRIAGKADLYRADTKELIDWKVTSVYSFLLGDKPDWAFQNNANAYIWGQNGFEVERLSIKAILRDWRQRDAQQRQDYPPIPYQDLEIPLWGAELAERRLTKAIGEHKKARAGQPRPCTPEERWERPAKYAVMKQGQKRAVRLFDSEEDAEALVEEKKPLSLSVQHRPGEQVRCGAYCAARPWCKQADALGVPRGNGTG